MAKKINTGGGTYIGGNTKVDRGSQIVGRDQVGRDIVIAGGGNIIAGPIEIGEDALNKLLAQSVKGVLRGFQPEYSKEALQQTTEAYLRYLVNCYRYLNLKGMGVSERVPLRLALLDLYVPLKARLELPEGETWKRDRQHLTGELAGRQLSIEESQTWGGRLGEPQPVINLLRDHNGLIVLGDPGAGKTTLLKFLALQLALGQGEAIGLGNRLPVLVPLSAYANALRDEDLRLDAFIDAYLCEAGIDGPDQVLSAALKSGTALILLDGFDEVKDTALRQTVIDHAMDFYASHRQKGNKFVITSRVVGYRAVRPTAAGLAECTLIDFDDDEIAAFAARWTVALEKQAQDESSLAYREAERERRELLDAVQRNPSVRRLAANPLLLTILALMKRQGVTLPERRVELYDQYVKTLLSSWNRARGLGRPPARDLDVVQTVRVLAPLALWMHEVNPGMGLVKREALRHQLEAIYAERGEANPEAATSQFIEDVHGYAGLLLERGPGEYGFIHLTFEEYLAAVAVALKGQGNAVAMAGDLSAHVGEDAWREVALLTIGYVGLIQQLDQVAGATAEQLAASPRGEAGQAAVLAGEAVLDAQPGGVPVASKRKVIDVLITTMQGANVKPTLRRRAGLLLGRLGWTPADLDQFVEIPAGQFLYDDKKETREIPYRYWIAKYPVTNLQFKRFMAANGYEDQRWWSTTGWSWRQDKDRKQPAYWDDHERANPIFPVMGVSWFEVEAYCNWLNQQLTTIPLAAGQVARPEEVVVRLAREEEWERAARGVDGREYPWGAEFDQTKANTYESGGIDTTAICTYPQGASPTGAWDMSGNVWEWTYSRYDKDKPARVLRGGSWGIGHRHARCADRFWSDPDYFNYNLGFRVVWSLAYSEF